jgi:uncharacterized membrane protein YeaQ/YmgE (transglycosylase-associated protein family)
MLRPFLVMTGAPQLGVGMTTLLGFVGSVVGGYAGWYVGAPFGFFAGFLTSTIGGGVGIYYGRKVGKRYE